MAGLSPDPLRELSARPPSCIKGEGREKGEGKERKGD